MSAHPCQDDCLKIFCDSIEKALSRYEAGEEDVTIEHDGISIRLYNLRDNADRTVVRMTLDDVRLLLIGAARVAVAGSTMGALAGFYGFDLRLGTAWGSYVERVYYNEVTE